MAEIVAVACVVESSLFLASEWSTILVEYISPLLKRLGEVHAAHTLLFRLAFVAYGPGDTRPSPLIAKRFFTALPMITKELREEQHKLGIGQTSCGGSRGMAALEGLVAAIELFDILGDSVKVKPLQAQAPYQPPRLVSHIIHVAASPPDGAPKPLWNDSPRLDNVTWGTIPAELKKRNISLSVINMRPNAPLAELHLSAASKGVSPPWFKIRAPHSVLLAGFPAELKSKRPNESQASPDTKRAKIHPTPASSTSTSSTASAPVTQTPPMILPQPPGGPAQTKAVITARSMPNPVIIAKWRELEAQVQKLERDHEAAVTQGRMDVAAQIKNERDKMFANLEKFKSAVQSIMRVQQQQQAQTLRTQSGSQGQQAQPQPLPANPSVSAAASGSSIQTSPRVAQILASSTMVTSAAPPDLPRAPIMPGRTGAPSFPQMSTTSSGSNLPLPAHMTPEMASQMQKLVDNHGIRPRQASFSQPQPPQKNPAPPSQPMPGPSQQQSTNSTWEGALTWTGFDVTTHDRKEMHAQVSVASHSGDILPATWPNTLTLTPSREGTASMPELQSWAKRTKAILCTFHAKARTIDQQTNEQNFRSLIDMLTQKRIYALASWTLPSGQHATNLLIFPFNGGTLVGTAFPTTGIPEMPKPATTPLPLPSNVQAQLQRLTPEQRSLFMAQMMRQKNQQMQQQQQQAFQQQQQQQQTAPQPGSFANAMPMNGGPYPAPSNFSPQIANNMMNLMGSTTIGGAHMMNLADTQAGMLHRRTPSGNQVPQAGGVGGVGYDIMQSFMQRNADGSGGPVMGP